MEIEIEGMKVTLDPKRATVRIHLGKGNWVEKQGVEVVLLFALLAEARKLAK